MKGLAYSWTNISKEPTLELKGLKPEIIIKYFDVIKTITSH